MKLKRTLKLSVSAVLSVAAIVLLDGETIAQDSRPRYSTTQPADRGLTLPPDTVINVQMNTTLSSRTDRGGDKVTETVTVPVYINGQTVIPAGAIVEGRVTQVTPAKRMNRSGTIGIDFDALVFPNGNAVQLVGSLTSPDSDTQRRIDDERRASGKGNDRAQVEVRAPCLAESPALARGWQESSFPRVKRLRFRQGLRSVFSSNKQLC